MAFVTIPGYTMNSVGKSCFFCTSSQSKKNPIVIDCQKTVSFEGSVHVCGQCATHLGEAAGGVSEKTATQLKEQRDALKAEAERLTTEVDALNEVVGSLRALDALQTAAS